MTVIGALSSFRELGKMSPHKRPCIDWSGHLRAARRKIANPQDAPSLALVMGVHRHDKPLKFWLHNSCTNAPEQRLFAQK
jgi:hypothetical protein